MKAISLLFIFSFGCTLAPEPQQYGIAPFQRQLRQCYLESDSYVSKTLEEQRTMVVSFMVNEYGQVYDPKVESSDFKDANFNACVTGIIRKATFEKGRPMSVQESINFNTVEP